MTAARWILCAALRLLAEGDARLARDAATTVTGKPTGVIVLHVATLRGVTPEQLREAIAAHYAAREAADLSDDRLHAWMDGTS